MLDNTAICEAMTIKLGNDYPDYPQFNEGIRRAPDRGFRLTKEQTKIALKNVLRYVPEELHEKLAPEFMEELATRGRIYAYRYRPEGRIYGKPLKSPSILTNWLHTERRVRSVRTGSSTD